jgi:hypothetical protein
MEALEATQQQLNHIHTPPRQSFIHFVDEFTLLFLTNKGIGQVKVNG